MESSREGTMETKEVPLAEPVEMPAPESIPAKGVDTSAAFGNPIGRGTEERLEELDDSPQSEESAVVASGPSISKSGGRLAG